MANVKLSAIASGGAVAGATDVVVAVRSGTTDLLVTPVTLDLAQTWTAAQTFTNSDLKLLGSSTGATTFTSDNAGATNYTMQVPAANDTLAVIGAAQTFTSKTLTAPTINGVVGGTATSQTFTALTTSAIHIAPVAGGSTKTLTAANAGTVTFLDTAGGTVVTLPAATGTGDVFWFNTTVTTTSAAHKILAVGSDYLIGMINGVRTTTLTPFLALVGSVYQSLQMPFAGSQPSGGIQGDWFMFRDVAAAKWHVHGQFSAGTAATTPFSTATS